MKFETFRSITDSYDEIMDFIFPPNLYYDEFRVGSLDMFLPQLKVLHRCSTASWVGTNGWKKWLERTNGKVNWSKSNIGMHRIYLSDGWNAQFKKRHEYLAYTV